MTIVVGTDFSPGAFRAVRIAALLANRLEEQLHVVHVSQDPRAPLFVGTPEEALLAEDRGKLLDTLANLDVKPNTPITSELLAGSAADGLCEAAELRRASLLIASTMGRSGAFFGGTIERVVRSVRVPVLAIRAPEHLESWLERNVTLRVMIGSDL